jgi:cytochrome c
MRLLFVTAFFVLAFFVLAACSPPSERPEAAPSSPASAPTAQTEEQSEEAAEMQARVAALPAPYNEAGYETGRRAFGQCRSCHTIDQGGANGVGPNLYGVAGRQVAAGVGFTYSQALQDADFTWDTTHLDPWIANPRTYLPGSRMAFAGVRNETQRRDLIAYLSVSVEADDE